MKVGTGAFTGIHINSTNASLKFFAKVAAKVDVFSYQINAVDMEISIDTSGKILHYKVYLKQGFTVDQNDNKKLELTIDPRKVTANIAKSRRIFSKRWPIFVYVGTLNVYISGTLSSGMEIGTYASASLLPPTSKGSLDTKLSLNLHISGGTYASLLVNCVIK